jgi:aromatic-L-amino-acid decarboxylase
MVAIVAARSRYQALFPDVPVEKLSIYVTTQTHSLGLKAGLVLGLFVRTIPVRAEDNYSLRGEDLREVIENDKAEGRHPFVIGNTRFSRHHGSLILYFSRYRRDNVKRCDRQY